MLTTLAAFVSDGIPAADYISYTALINVKECKYIMDSFGCPFFRLKRRSFIFTVLCKKQNEMYSKTYLWFSY